MELILRDSPDLEGTGAITLRASPMGLDVKSGDTVRVRFRGRSCGAVVQRVDGVDGEIHADKYIRGFLRNREGDTVEVIAASFPTALSVSLHGPSEWAEKDGADLLRTLLNGRPVTINQKLSVPVFSGDYVIFEILSTNPAGIATVHGTTMLTVETKKLDTSQDVTFKDIGGLGPEVRRIRELIEGPLLEPERFGRLGIEAPRGLILYGPPGTGKTLVAKALSLEVGAECLTIQGPEIVNPYYGESEKRLRDIFDQASAHAPAIILIDELDAITPKREDTRDELERRLVTMLLTLMDGLVDRREVVVIGTTNRLDSIDPALRRPGRFEHEIHVGIPDRKGRREILDIRTRRMPLASDVRLDDIANQTAGYVGADLASLCREAAYSAWRRIQPDPHRPTDNIDRTADVRIGHEDFRAALAAIKPSAVRELVVEVPDDVDWQKIGGLDDVKEVLIENVIYGIQKPEVFRDVGIKPGQGLLLYGPPGTGKTLLATAIARAAGTHLVVARGPEVCSKWFGESERRIRFLFAKAREVAPCVILFDELDAIAAPRGGDYARVNDSIVNQLLTEMDGLRGGNDVFVIGTTNRSELIDQALLRPGRFDYQIFVPLPDLLARKAIFAIHLDGKPPTEDVDIDDLAAACDGLSGADIAEVCRLAVLNELRVCDFKPDGLRLRRTAFKAALDSLRKTQSRLQRHGF